MAHEQSLPAHQDVDGVLDVSDNCPATPNADQADSDADGVGDACDGDFDGDGVLNGADVCAFTPGATPVDAEKGALTSAAAQSSCGK